MPPPKGYLCTRAEFPPGIDGRLDDACWQAAHWTEDFVDIEGDSKPRPRFRTRAKMLWDDHYLYIGAELEEPHVWGTLTHHDSVIFQDNDFEIFIDPDGDNHNYFEIEINALNTEWDLRLVKPYRDGGPALNEWEIPGFRSAVYIDGTLNDPSDKDRGWSVEMAIPWSALAKFAGCPTPPAPGDQWRMNFSRVEWQIEIVGGKYHKIPNQAEDNWVWSPQIAVDMHRPEMWGYVQFANSPAEPFHPDPTWDARELLMAVYYAQKQFHKERGRWSDRLDELGIGIPAGAAITGLPHIRLDKNGYVATVECHPGPGPARRLHVRQDSRLWEDRP